MLQISNGRKTSRPGSSFLAQVGSACASCKCLQTTEVWAETQATNIAIFMSCPCLCFRSNLSFLGHLQITRESRFFHMCIYFSETHTVLIASKLATKAPSHCLSSGTTSQRSLPRKVKGSRMRTCMELMSPKSPGLGRSWEPAKVFSWNSCTAIKLASCSGLRPAAVASRMACFLLQWLLEIWQAHMEPLYGKFPRLFPYFQGSSWERYGSHYCGSLNMPLTWCFSWHVLPVSCFDPWKYRLNTWHQSRSDIFFTQRYLRCTRNNAYIPENYHDKGKQPF